MFQMFQTDAVLSARAGSTLVPDRTSGKEMKSNPLILFYKVILASKIPLCLPGMESEEALDLI